MYSYVREYTKDIREGYVTQVEEELNEIARGYIEFYPDYEGMRRLCSFCYSINIDMPAKSFVGEEPVTPCLFQIYRMKQTWHNYSPATSYYTYGAHTTHTTCTTHTTLTTHTTHHTHLPHILNIPHHPVSVPFTLPHSNVMSYQSPGPIQRLFTGICLLTIIVGINQKYKSTCNRIHCTHTMSYRDHNLTYLSVCPLVH